MNQKESGYPCIYFEEPGAQNTLRTLEIASARAQQLDLQNVLVASTSGETGLKALDFFTGRNLVIVSHSTGFKEPDFQQLPQEVRDKLEAEKGLNKKHREKGQKLHEKLEKANGRIEDLKAKVDKFEAAEKLAEKQQLVDRLIEES